MDFSQLRTLGNQLAEKASEVNAAQASEWTEQAVRGAVDTTLNVIEIAADEATKREIRGNSINVSAAVNIGVVQLSVSVEFSKVDLADEAEGPRVQGSVERIAEPVAESE